MASDAYWNATKPNGMPDYVWQEMQAKKKAEEEAKKKAAEEAARKAAEQLLASVPGSGIVPSTQDKINSFGAASVASNIAFQEAAKKAATNNASSSSTSKHDGTSTNDARAEQMAIKNNTTPDYSKDYTGYEDDTSAGGRTHSSGSARTPSDSSNASTQSGNGYVSVADLNKPTNGSDKKPSTSNEGLTTDDARKEHIDVMNNPTVNPPTDSQISAGAVTPSTNGGTSNNTGTSGGASSSNNTVSTPTITPVPSAEELANYVSTIITAAKDQLGEVKAPTYAEATKPGAVTLRSLEDLANTYGITYDYDKLYGLFNDSVEAQYDAIYAKQRQNEAAYYDNATAAQNTLLDTLSRDRSSAVQAGVSKGMQAANALGAMLGVSQQFANNATTLSQERSNTAKDYGADLAQAKVDAEAASNERKNAIMEIAKMLYGYDSEQYVANMDNYNTILTNNAALQQTYMNNKASLQNALASIFGSAVSNKITGDANVLSNSLAAEAQKYAANQSLAANQAIANANRDAANASAEANKWIAQLQLGLLDANEVGTSGSAGKVDSDSSTSNKDTAKDKNNTVAYNWLDILSRAAYNTQSGSTNNMYWK